MFEKEIRFIYDISLNHIKQLGSYFTFDELVTSYLHPAIIKYISAEIDYLIYEDRQKLLANSNFNYSGEEINRLFESIASEIKHTKKFSFDYISNLTLHAISFTINYIAQPDWALLKLLFAKEEVLRTSEVVQVLEYLYYYDYLKDIITGYLARKNSFPVRKSDFEVILEKIDREIYLSPSESIINNVLSTMGEFTNIGGVNKGKIPFLMFELFIREKKLDEYFEKLNTALGGEVKSVYLISDLKKIIYSPVVVKKESPVVRDLQQEDTVKKDEPLKDEVNSIEADIIPVIAEGTSVVSDIMQNRDEITSGSIEEIPPVLLDISIIAMANESSEEIENETTTEDSPGFILSGSELIEKQDQPEQQSVNISTDIAEAVIPEENAGADVTVIKGNAEVQPLVAVDEQSVQENLTAPVYFNKEDEKPDGGMKKRPKRKEITNFFSNRERNRIVKNIFNNSGEVFISTFADISESEDLAAARKIVYSLFVENDIDPTSKEARVIQKIITKYFNQA
ncbi:MAG: hypothetical protein WCJ01_10710 [Ignavibacteria bacterium]